MERTVAESRCTFFRARHLYGLVEPRFFVREASPCLGRGSSRTVLWSIAFKYRPLPLTPLGSPDSLDPSFIPGRAIPTLREPSPRRDCSCFVAKLAVN